MGWRRTAESSPTTKSMDLLRLVVVCRWGKVGRRRRAILAVSSGAEKALPQAARACLCPPPAGATPSLPVQASSALSSVAIATSISTLAHLLQGTRQAVGVPAVLLQASQRSRITPVGLALVAKWFRYLTEGRRKDPGAPQMLSPSPGAAG